MKVLITGGSRGIGRALVELYAKSGDEVVFLYRANDDAANEVCAKTGARAIKCDVSSSADATAAVEQQ